MTDTMRKLLQLKHTARVRYARTGTARWTLLEDQGFQALLPWLGKRWCAAVQRRRSPR